MLESIFNNEDLHYVKVNFRTEDHPELNLDFHIIPNLFRVSSELQIGDELIKPVEPKKNKYEFEWNETTYNIRLLDSPFGSKVKINLKEYDLPPKTEWYNYLIGGLPFVLMVSGGALGAFLGYIGWHANMNYLNFGTGNSKYIKILLVTAGIAMVYFVASMIIQIFIK